MKKLMLIAVALLLVAPAMATVNFSATDAGGQKLKISYASTAGELPRGVALKVTITGDATVAPASGVVATAPAFNCFIDYAYSNQGTYAVGQGHPLANPAGPGVLAAAAKEFSVCMGVLDQSGAQGAGPLSADLATLQLVFTGSNPVTVSIAADTLRGPASGVVGSVLPSNLEAGPISVQIAPPITECVKNTASFYQDWVTYGKPACWCYKYQCRGDGDGKPLSPTVNIPVTLTDLTRFRLAINKLAGQLPADGICYDADKLPLSPTVQIRVTLADLNNFRQYINKLNPPVCDQTNFNFWITP